MSQLSNLQLQTLYNFSYQQYCHIFLFNIVMNKSVEWDRRGSKLGQCGQPQTYHGFYGMYCLIKHLRHAFYFFSNHSTICVTIAFCLVTLQEVEELLDNPSRSVIQALRRTVVLHAVARDCLFFGMLIVVMGDSLFGFVVLIVTLQEIPFHRAPK